MAVLIKQSTTQHPLLFFLTGSSDHITGLTGASPTVTISKAGASFGSPSGSVSEIANGWYQVAGNATDTNTLGLIALHAVAASADPCDMAVGDVVAFDPTSSTLGVSYPSNFSSMSINASGFVAITSNVKTDTALNGFTFTMTNSTTHAPQTGLSVTAQRSLAGGSFASCANSVTEISNGNYTINLAAADLNAATVMLRFTATNADDLNILVVTQP